MFIIDKKFKMIFLIMLLMILATRYVFLVNQEKSVNKVLITYASSFETANILNEIDSAVSSVKSSEDIIKTAKELEVKKTTRRRSKKEKRKHTSKNSY